MSIRFVKDLAFRIFRYMMPSAERVDEFEYPNHCDASGRTFQEIVGKWKSNAAIGYQSMDAVHKSEVAELRWYKNVEGLEHEYMVATCRQAGEVDVYLRLERRPYNLDSKFVVPELALPPHMTEKFNKEQAKSLRADVEAERKIVQKTVWRTVQKSVSKSKNNLKASDSVTRVRNNEGFLGEPARLIAGYQNFRQPFYVRDLAFLTCAVSEHDPTYQFYLAQRYWYIRTLVDTAVAIYQPTTIISGDGFDAAGTYTVGRRLRPTPGFENTLQVFVSNDPQEVDQIKTAFRDSIALHDRQVSPTSLQQPTPPFDQAHPGSQASTTAPATPSSSPFSPEIAVVGSILQQIPTVPNTINIITINFRSGNVTGNRHTNVSNIAPRGHQDTEERRGCDCEVD